MRVLFISHFFPPEELSSAILVEELATAVAERGHQVDVLTGFPNWPRGKCFKGYSSEGFVTEKMGGLNIHRIPFMASPNGSFLQRVLDFKSFEYNVKKYGKSLQRPDLIFVPVPPNEDALAARALARHFRCKYVVNVQDIQPDGAIELGYIRNPLAIKILRWQERLMYADAAHIVPIGDNFRKQLEAKGIAKEKISVLPNWIDAEAIAPMSRMNALRLEWGIPEEKFVLLYAGTFGRIHGTESLLEAARCLKEDKDIQLLMVGQGYDFERCRKTVEEEGLVNVLVKSFVPRSRLRELQAIADLSIVSLKKGFGHSSVPSKVLGYMSAGRGVLAFADHDCDTALLINEARCGLVLEPGNVEHFVVNVLGLRKNQVRVAEWGRNARSYIVSCLDRKVVTSVGVDMLERILTEQDFYRRNK